MRHVPVALAAASVLAAFAPAQAPCTGWPPGGVAFLADCPCGAYSDPDLRFQGTARIGSVQRFTANSVSYSPVAAFLVIGLATVTPLAIPMGTVACGQNSSSPMAPIQSIAIDPLLVAPITFYQNSGNSSPNWYPLPYYLFVPYLPAAVGATLHAQYFQEQIGLGSPPLATSHTIGFTLQP